jgi:DNA-binding LacI/PurR family transcriptional regulator
MILAYEPSDRKTGYLVELLHRLQAAGHVAGLATKTMRELGMNLTRIARFVEKTEADAWVVVTGSREVLEWFAARPVPAFALFGRSMQVGMASTAPKKSHALFELVDRLVALRHRRIVMLVREERRKPGPGFLERLFLDHLEAHRIPTRAYNLPDWGDTPEEFERMLDSLYRLTPPTALILDEPALFFAATQHLAGVGIAAASGVSMACCDWDPAFEWCRPSVAHIAWDSDPVVNRVVNWANHVSHGKEDWRKTWCKARFVDGGTIGPAP